VYSSPVHVGQQELLFSIVHDITDRVHAEEQLRLAAGVFTQAREGIMITDSKAHIVDVNDAFTSITGYSREEVLGQNPSMLSSGRYDHQFYSAMWRDLEEKDHWYGEIWNRRKNGELYASLLTISALRDTDGNTRHYVALFSDITVLKENERELEHIAHHDALTGLPNRLLLGDRLRQAMVQESRRGQFVAVAFLDLDGFKEVNDQYGHESGDELLIAVAKRIKNVLREGDTLARIGGDEFVAVLPDLGAHEDCNPILSRMLGAAADKVAIRGQSVRVTASLGVTFYPQAEEVDADQLLRQADQAMYQAKLAGKNRYHVFDTEQDRSLRGRREELKRIGRALARNEFELYYQPKVNMRSGVVIGLEALIRWRHPEQGLVLPGAFLPVIEDHPMIVTLGEWTLASAMAQLSEWKRSGLHMRVSVNIAALHLQQRDFVGHLRELLAAHPDVSSDQIELEVLETSALENVSYVSKLIEDCRQLGVSFALDDFGTGYSSLTYLKRLPAQVLKIDRSFVRDMHDDPEDLAILEGVIGLAEAFRRQVIAEGVETVEHGELLLSLGCELAQGHAIGYPMPAETVPAWMANWHPPPSWIDRSVVHREQLPILYAIVEHRAWIAALEEYLEDKRSMPPALEPAQCRFGRWLQERIELGDEEVYAGLAPIHEQVHALAAEILARKAAGDSDLVRVRLGELHALRDRLLDTLYARIDRAGSPARAAVNS
jgi:diguanylate cyclase (GGDEF)-like protein/PAS domain S-box-containing protein